MRSHWARRVAGVAVAVVVAWGIWRSLLVGTPPDARARVVAVLPFEVEGGLERPLDAASISKLLRSYFGYTERYRSVPAVTVDEAVKDMCPTRPIERSCGSLVATEVGAQFHITGLATAVRGDSVQIVAYLTDEMTGRAIAPVSVRASQADAYDALNRLFRELAVSTATEGERVVALAGIHTDEPAALAAFLDGELLLAEFDWIAARTAFQRAVGIDSTFALAWYRLAILWDWSANPHKTLPAIARAEAHSDQLSEHDRRLLGAFRLLIAGEDLDRVEMTYLDLLEEDPDDVEALFQLGLMRWAYNWHSGRSVQEAIAPLQRYRELVPKDCMGAIYLAWGLAAAGDADGLAALKADTDEGCRNRPMSGPSIQAIRAYRVGDTAAYLTAMDSIAVDPYGNLVFLGTMHGVVPDIARLAEIERGYPTPNRDDYRSPRGYYMAWIDGATYLAGIELGTGRRSQAWRALERLDSLPVTPAIAYLGALATILPGDSPSVDAATITARVDAWDPPTYADLDTMPYAQFGYNWKHAYWGPYERSYLLGLLASQAGDYRTALEYAEELEAMPPYEYFPSINADLALGVRADVLFNEGRPAEALAALDSASWGISYNELIFVPMVGGQREVFLEAMILQQLGRYQEALALYTYGIEHSMPGPLSYPLLAPSHLYRGQIYEDMGDIEQALWHYEAFVELWRDADPEYQPMVEDAREQMGRLTSELGAGG